ncbi:Signal transducer and activator of transcription 5A [Trichoplax sp. H2]|nr:Signal transducer and activator of transcription 5A [Trichoplax sp. H2]|eukprot:RDD41569.1 Signal transducer and activator of transcription 5A [Trichoplax sp. H2]
MSRKFWINLTMDQQARIYNFYDQYNFPIEIRIRFNNWIQEAYKKILNTYEYSPADYCEGIFAKNLYQDLLNEIQNTISNLQMLQPEQATEDQLVALYNLNKNLKTLQDLFQSRPEKLLKVITEGIRYEERVEYDLHRAAVMQSPQSPEIPILDGFLEQLHQFIKDQTNKVDGLQSEVVQALQQISSMQSGIGLDIGLYQNYSVQNGIFSQTEIIKEDIMILLQKMSELIQNFIRLNEVIIQKQLRPWKMSQMTLFSLKEQKEHSYRLDVIQNSMEVSYDLLEDAGKIIKSILCHYDAIYQSCDISLEQLRQFDSIIVNQQYQLIYKFLLGHKLGLLQAEVEATILGNDELKHILATNSMSNNASDAIQLDPKLLHHLNNQLPFKPALINCQNKDNGLTAHFRDWKLSKTERGDNGNARDRLVTEKKCAIIFILKFNLNETAMKRTIISLPIILTVNSNQTPSAWGTIIWDSYFSDPDRNNLDAPDEVPWKMFFSMLDMEFHKRTERSLDNEHEQCLRELYCNINEIAETDPNQLRVTRKDFYRSSQHNHPISGLTSPTFWKWLYGILEMLEKRSTIEIRSLWKNGHIVGFVTKSRVREILRSRTPGTFLIRFSTRVYKALSFCFVTERGDIQLPEPLDEKMLTVPKKSLAETINGIRNLAVYYPTMAPKSDVADQCGQIDNVGSSPPSHHPEPDDGYDSRFRVLFSVF